jgi:hypothetical protein
LYQPDSGSNLSGWNSLGLFHWSGSLWAPMILKEREVPEGMLSPSLRVMSLTTQ